VDDTGHARITDFGLAMVTRNLGSMLNAPEYQGYVRWNAPEILTERGTYSKEADLFSFAMVMIEVQYKWDTLFELWLTVIRYHHRDLLGRSLSLVAKKKVLCWQ
jgi:serine/threonine protein kinase